MNLKRYRVENFRSVHDSGWIECTDVTTLIGINEAGKSNLLLALWKLKPAREGKIDMLHDMPVASLSAFRKIPDQIKFITAEFEIDDTEVATIESELGCDLHGDTLVTVTRYFDGSYTIEFPSGPLNSTEFKEVANETDTGVAHSEEPKEIPWDDEDLIKTILNLLPNFVYYSNYGNLSSKIYLPNVIKWLEGKTVEGIDVNDDQVRTLRVLFEFVGLDPKEILELGKDPKEMAMKRGGRGIAVLPTAGEIEKAENDKEERSILLQSASGNLTKKFKEWWKQGEYKFRFEADGDYFRIWVSDKVRTDEVALELRSTGLQWFISFYLIFLVESQSQHENSILLLDEAGLTLHPLAQKDLSGFFANLSQNNQIINTTHSPFIVDTTNIDRCRVVYMDSNGYTVASSNLRQGSDALNEKSIYAVHAALGLSVSDVLLQGCQTIVVEGPSDQFYFNAIKSFLIREKLFVPAQDMVFVPSGGVRGVPGVVSLISSKTEELPFVIIDSDKSGQEAKKKLESGLYKDFKKRIIDIKDYTGITDSEIEDLIPFSLLKKGVNRIFNKLDEVEFEDEHRHSEPIVPQIKNFAKNNEIPLIDGWKVELAVSAKKQLDTRRKADLPEKYVDAWQKIFKSLS